MTPNVDRLKQLRRVVEAAPEGRFNMRHWSIEQSGCGTAYCAAGWAAVDPWFQENTPIGDVFRVTTEGDVIPIGDGDTIAEELADIFGISVDDSDNLFTEGADLYDACNLLLVTKAQVLTNIDRLIAGQPARSYREYQHEAL